MPTKLTGEIIAAAIEGFESKKAQIDAQIAELRRTLSGRPAGTALTLVPAGRGRRGISAEGRARIAEAQRKRWAETKKAGGAAAPKTAKPKRKLSAAGRRAIVAALKKRWAAKRAGAAK
jgi:hypothetical protein